MMRWTFAFLLWVAHVASAVTATTSFIGSTRFLHLDADQVVANSSNDCNNQNMRVRKEWRRLTSDEKSRYIKAVQCLHESPPKSKKYFEGAQSRYDDFVGLHINATNGVGGIHNVGVFLPWHRLSMWNYETVLRNECNYTGAQPYWDYTLDTPERGGHWLTSPVLDPKTGFGGDGNATYSFLDCLSWNGCPPRCVLDGPFAKYKIYLGPGNSTKGNPRCLSRQLNPQAAEEAASPRNLYGLMNKTTYEEFQNLDNGRSDAGFHMGFHTVGHMGIGGDMTNLWSSTNDPLFFLHHTELDRLWATWQGNNATRLHDIAAPTDVSIAAFLGLVSAKKTDAKTMVWMGQFPPSLEIGKLTDTQNRDGNGALCYRYDD